ncbi:uncharacterized protein [Ranitomeya imitator]|uniref:uncharacterized protein n=1 Tax=Ranitomeya imitator TaxID=111125 RepID=UPI0037E77C04
MLVCVPPFLTLLLYSPTGALFHDGAYPGSETSIKPPEISNISAGPADLVVSLTNATFPSDTTTHQNKVMDSTAFVVKIFEPLSIKPTERETPTVVPLMKPIGRNDALSPTPKPHGDITLPPMDQEMEFKTSVVTSSLILSTTTRITNIPHELTRNIIDEMHTAVYTHSNQETSQLTSSLPTPTQAKTALPGFTTDGGSTRPSDTITQSTTKGVSSIQPRFMKNIIDVAGTTVCNHSLQTKSSLTSPTLNSQTNTALPGFTTDRGSIRPSDTIIPSTTKGFTSIQPRFTTNIIDIADTTVYNHNSQPISSLTSPTSNSQANTALPGFTTERGSIRPSDTIIPSTTKRVISTQTRFTKNIIDVGDSTVYNHGPQSISSLSSPTSKSNANTALPGFTTDQGSTRPSGSIIPSTSRGITSIQSVFTKNIIDVAHTAVYTHSHQETSQLLNSSYISTTTIPSSSSMSAPVKFNTTASTMQETTWPTNDMLTTTTEDTTNTMLIPNKTPPSILPLKSKVSEPKSPSMTMADTSVSLTSNNPSTMLPAIMSSGKAFNVTGSWSPETKSAPMPPGTRNTTIPYIETPQSSPASERSKNSRINTNTSSTTETTEEQSSEITTTGSEYTFNPKITVSNSGGRIILRVKLVSSPTTNFAVAMRDLLQQTCLLLDQQIPAEDVTVSWAQQMFLPCLTIMEMGF